MGYFSTTCTSDRVLNPNALGVLTLPSRTIPLGVTVSANSSADTAGYIGELNYLTWLNVKMTLQYTHFTKFNGSTNNYDRVGRNASDDDVTYLNMWFAS